MMSVLSPQRAAEIEADPPCITFGEVRWLIAASKANDDLVMALKMAREWVQSLHNEAAMFWGKDATVTSQGALDQIDAALRRNRE